MAVEVAVVVVGGRPSQRTGQVVGTWWCCVLRARASNEDTGSGSGSLPRHSLDPSNLSHLSIK